MVLTGSARGRESVHDGFKLYSKAAGPGEAEVGTESRWGWLKLIRVNEVT